MGKPTAQEAADIQKWLNETTMCRHCNHRVPTTEVEQGLHEHQAAMG